MRTARSKREQIRYDAGIDRSYYKQILSHCSVFSRPLRTAKMIEFLAPKANDGVMLELGSSCWHGWFEKSGLTPNELHCINISQNELQTGIELAERSRLSPTFHLMDAQKLQFESDKFDVVYGGGILHHLDLDIALDEIARVLKPNGIAFFHEPLDINPVGKLVRYFTPNARTADEVPFTFKEIAIIEKHFESEIETFEFCSVPFGLISKFFFKSADNPMTKSIHWFDVALKSIFPPIKWFYRNMNIYIQSTKIK